MVKRVFSLLSALVVLSMVFMPAATVVMAAGVGPESADGEQPTLAPANYWIIQLEDPALAQYTGGISGLRATAPSVTGASRLDVNSSASRAYIAYLEMIQDQTAQAVRKVVPGTVVERNYQVTFNGLAVKLPEADPQAAALLRSIPGVKDVYRQHIYYPTMYASLPLIDAPALWEDLGGQETAGEGIKVAVIDSGIYITNTCFSPTGYTYPEGFPKMDDDKPAATNEKVIVARAYLRPDDPPVAGSGATWAGPNDSSHATHVAGTIACNAGTIAAEAGYTETISGVAPAAQLMSYKVFYHAMSGEDSSYDAEMIAAIEDAVADGADVVNNSWGGGSPSYYPSVIDLAYDAAWDAGVVIVFSAGNSGPYPNSTDHVSAKNITVGASSTTGTIAAGRLDVSAPEPVSETLQSMAYATADFGSALEPGQVYVHDYLPAAVVSPTNAIGCNPWPAGSFTGKAALISRGICNFSLKVYYAQQAGAEFVVIYNNAGDGLIGMAAGDYADEVTISSIFVGQTNGEQMVAWYGLHGEDSEVTLNYVPYQLGNVSDRLADFSSRGATALNTIGVDVVAPGVSIYSSGYGAINGHAGFGQAGGTSMAAPHVSGSAALLKQLHSDWTPAQIKSALMSTAELDLLDYDNSEVGALDRGSGRIDLSMAGDPGLTFDMPSLSFGKMMAGDVMTTCVRVTDVYSREVGTAMTYALSVSETGDVTTTAAFDISVSPASVVFTDDGQMADVCVTVEASEVGDFEGMVSLNDGTHDLHIPVWLRVWPEMGDEILVLDSDFSSALGYADYARYYTETLESLSVPYDYYDADMYAGFSQSIPDQSVLQQYKAIIFFTGDHWQPDGTYTVPTPLTEIDQDILVGYLQGGGRLLATGQDLTWVLDIAEEDNRVTNFPDFLGAEWAQDDVFSGTLGTDPRQLQGLGFVDGMRLDVSLPGTIMLDGAGNQFSVDEIQTPELGEGQPVPPLKHQPIFQATSGDHSGDGIVAMANSSDATLEDPQTYADYRTVYLSFGFEGINNPAPESIELDSRGALMENLLGYLFTQPTASLSAEIGEGGMVTLTATTGFATDDVADIVAYRWDFGDGSAIETTTVPTTMHTFASGRIVRVEVTDSYGHTALASTAVNVQGMIYLPLIMRDIP